MAPVGRWWLCGLAAGLPVLAAVPFWPSALAGRLVVPLLPLALAVRCGSPALAALLCRRARAFGLPPLRVSARAAACCPRRTAVAALQTNPEARKLLRHGKKERTIIQPRASGLLPLKARLDVHNESKRQIIELKTTRDLGVVTAAMQRYRYWLSAAFYQHLVGGQSVVFVFVQTTPPHDVAVIPLERPQLQAGREQWQSALARFDDCWQRNDWPEAIPETLEDDPLWLANFPVAKTRQPPFQRMIQELKL